MGKLEFYTDGACSHNGTWKGGYSIVIVENDELIDSYSDSKEHTTNNEMELMAFDWALGLASSMNHIDSEFIIYSDSAYIVNCFKDEWYIKWQKNGWRTSKKEPVAHKELWQSILKNYKQLGNRINIVKVKGHSNNKFNNLADKLAVEASK